MDFIDFVKSYNKTTNAPVDTTRIDRSKLTGALVANHVIAFKLQIKDLAVLEISDELSRGAHPNFNVNFLNWDIKTDKAITADDIFIGNYKAPLTAIAEKIFRKKRGIQKRAKLSGYNFENDIFALNNNFYITSKGITYLYNRYEITAYSEGEIELVIPYQLIKNLLRPNTVVSQFIK
ncbi:RsiV family protein [Mucilaginibacter sp.]|uniref:RsiV family protein n=1 Tax=Mucilaginibacter sp. TaxID=1882438 RepID=UPI002ED4534B